MTVDTDNGREHGDVISAYYPDVIETSDDSPVLLSDLLPGSFDSDGGASGLRVVRIDGCDTSSADPTELPGIRVGDGDGSGYILRRALDSQFVFVPDVHYSGVTTFTYTIADDAGDEATIVATVSVQPAALIENQITFTNGSLSVGVVEGTDAAILGAVAFNGAFQRGGLEFRVFEGETDAPSQRFAITGDKLRALERLDSAADSLIILRVGAYEGGSLIATSELTVEVHPEGTTASAVASGGVVSRISAAAGLGLSAVHFSADAASNGDQFHFMPEVKSGFETATVVAFRAPLEIGEAPEMAPAAGKCDYVADTIDETSKSDPSAQEGCDWFGV